MNARDAMPDGGVITILCRGREAAQRSSAKGELAAGDYVCIAVADSGRGMDEETWRGRSSRFTRPRVSARGPVWLLDGAWPRRSVGRRPGGVEPVVDEVTRI